MPVAQFIDHTILKNTTTIAEIEKICSEAMEYSFAAVCVPPYYVRDAREILGDSPIPVATVIGFPFGYSHYRSKVVESEMALMEGARELDMVMNLAAFKSNDLAYLETEINEVLKTALDKQAKVKVIIESGILNKEEIIKCCDLYRHFPIHYMKTSTGYAEKGATIEAVKTLRKHLPDHIGIKASGGIKTYEFARELVQAGATRLGCSASIAIVKGEKAISDSY